ncbi:hypothetical protein [Corynebacterium variabile]|uniref:hypothetical protein n=1 Tax=Corynebacterium variabile TaxID=1727 RepID=UPI002FE1EDB7
MARFTVRLDTPVPPAEAWRRVWNLDAHTRFIPLTTLREDGTGGTSLQAGSRFVARTALGPLHVDDVMEVRRFDAPGADGGGPAAGRRGSNDSAGAAGSSSTAGGEGRAVVVKTGRLIGGQIDATVSPITGSGDGGEAGSRLEWTQDLTLRGVPALADPLVAAVGRLAYGTVLRRLLRSEN